MLEPFLRIVGLFIMMGAGFVLFKLKKADAAFSKQLSYTQMMVFYPCMIFTSLTRQLSFAQLAEYWILPVAAAGIMILGLAVNALVLRPFNRHWDPRTRRTADFCGLMNNYSFLPILLVASLFGDKAIALVIFAAFGVELVVWTVGVETISGAPFKWRSLKNLLTMPMFAIAASIALLAVKHLGFVETDNYPSLRTAFHNINGTLHLMGQATIPASAVVCGIRMANASPASAFAPRILAMTAIRLLLIPAAAIALLYPLSLFFPVTMATDSYRVLVIIAVMPTAMASVVMSEIYDGDPLTAASAVLSSHIFCLATIPLWLHLLGIV